jgi:hypothetical protein
MSEGHYLVAWVPVPTISLSVGWLAGCAYYFPVGFFNMLNVLMIKKFGSSIAGVSVEIALWSIFGIKLTL